MFSGGNNYKHRHSWTDLGRQWRFHRHISLQAAESPIKQHSERAYTYVEISPVDIYMYTRIYMMDIGKRLITVPRRAQLCLAGCRPQTDTLANRSMNRQILTV